MNGEREPLFMKYYLAHHGLLLNKFMSTTPVYGQTNGKKSYMLIIPPKGNKKEKDGGGGSTRFNPSFG